MGNRRGGKKVKRIRTKTQRPRNPLALHGLRRKSGIIEKHPKGGSQEDPEIIEYFEDNAPLFTNADEDEEDDY